MKIDGVLAGSPLTALVSGLTGKFEVKSLAGESVPSHVKRRGILLWEVFSIMKHLLADWATALLGLFVRRFDACRRDPRDANPRTPHSLMFW
jgi:hypothetical protein